MADLDISDELVKLRTTYRNIVQVVDPDALRASIAELNEQAAAPGLWDDPEAAQKVTSKLAHTKSRLAVVEDLGQRLDDLPVLVELANAENDDDARTEATSELAALTRGIDELEVQTLLNGEYDDRDAVITIRAGAGGVDAADFAQMLMRMYLRWAEKHGYEAKVLDRSEAEEAGIKSTTFEIDAPYAYGTLSVEGGTHRLVRMSPFNSAGKRQTSFAAVEVVPLAEPTDHIDIPDSEIRIDVFHASGPGGQGVNTTDSAVRITHFPTGIVVSMQDERSQIQNKAAAMRILESKLLQLKHEEEDAKEKELRGDVKASWGDQMRSYVLAPYRMVKDLRTNYEENNPDDVFDGDIDGFISAGIRWRKTGQSQA
ncbi:MAG: peptide chain release factor 2 [Microbacteriaceae bacterium]|jgi:peptide chain release factor 2|nr:peptide chain release factor 2 [Microbacteriaceae bacterium]MCI1207496.1 peptide chain release factor 2 [Microbacteriaceae bacterium]